MSQQYSIQDLDTRKRALDVTINAIVTAGAGSGKTSILSQRHLACLLNVDRPEQVLSMTFTRDAAAEMRHRIVQALVYAKSSPRPDDAYQQTTYDLAKQVLKRDAEKDWNIINNPHRLSIMTIDSLCAQIVKQVPVLSGMGGDLRVVDDSYAYYVRASTNVIHKINDPSSGLVEDIKSLMLHLNGNQQRCVELMANMLAKRDQWMRHVSKAESVLDRVKMQSALSSLLRKQDEKTSSELGSMKFAISELLDFAALNVDASSPLFDGSQDEGFWGRAAELFLTGTNSVRKSVNKKQGFPAGADAKAQKERWKDVANQLTKDQVFLLAKHKKSPESYSEKQWQLLDSLFRLLWQAVIELKTLFIVDSQVDFTEVAQRALHVLRYDGEVERDVAFNMFTWYRHILVDEVQDTNRTQYDLIEALVSEWDPSMNNSLFMVGDPKQSIYRFREADVGLFMQSKEHGIGSLNFENLYLTSNFRSSDDIVNWNNDIYADVFPKSGDIAMGAVPYSSSTPVKNGKIEEAVTIVPLMEKSPTDEAEAVLNAVEESLDRDPNGSIAILVRARSHLTEIARLLFENKIAYHAVEIEQLSQRQIIIDAMSLTKAITHTYDNTAWLSIIRMPCVGLTLEDMTVLCERLGMDAIYERMLDESRLAKMSDVGRERISRLRAVMDWAFDNLGTVSLRQLVEGAWLQLSAPAGYSERDLRDVQTYFSLLDEYGFDTAIDFSILARRLDQLYAKPKFNSATRVTLMTMHKSKGLEFDTVIMPCLGHPGRGAESSLVMWHEFTADDSQDAELMVAPIKSVQEDSIYTYLMEMESEKEMYERMRLMYVGTTRPKAKLYLIGHISQEEVGPQTELNDLKAPSKNTLLSVIWEKVQFDYLNKARQMKKEEEESDEEREEKEEVKGFGSHYFKRVRKASIPPLRKDTHAVN